ncbi:MAG: ATP-dependent metallopeptidase FtsH/Yme1/Tma family protein, partial [bacterium]|nr:ATP-dependent metallopeptidase FtsH/Yme1/Tma family protein [bacterium]
MKKKTLSWRWILFILAAVLLLYFLFNPQFSSPQPEEMTYNNFLVKLDQSEEISSVVIRENADKTSGTIIAVGMKDGKYYKANFPLYLYPGLLERLEKTGVKLDVKPAQSSWSSFLWLILPLGLIFLLFFLLRKAGQQQMDKTMSFGQTKAQLVDPLVKERFSDVA